MSISLMSQHLGADEREEANRYATQLTAVAVLSGVVFGLIGSALSEPFVRLMGAQGDMMKYSAAYLHIQFLDTPFMFFYYIFNAIMNAQGNTLTPTLISGVSALMNMVLDPLFIFVFHMDVEGAALATVLSKVTMALAGAYVLWRNHGVISLDFHHFRFDKGAHLPLHEGCASIHHRTVRFLVRIHRIKLLHRFLRHCDHGCIWYGKQDL